MRKNEKTAKRGRPAFKATPAQRRRVSVAAGAGMAHEEIAIGLGICRNTLETYFVQELSVGAYSRRLEVLDAMHKTAVKGNVSAQKAYIALTPALGVPAPEKEEPVGKKEKANADARTAADGTTWDALLPKNVTPIRSAG